MVEKRLAKYLGITEKALKKAESSKKNGKEAEKIIDMCRRYLQDAKYFKEKGDNLTALCSVVYAHAWLDIGSHLGFLEVDDRDLFILPE